MTIMEVGEIYDELDEMIEEKQEEYSDAGEAPEPDEERRPIDVSEWPMHVVQNLSPTVRHMLQTGRVPEAVPVVPNTCEVPKGPWRSSIAFVEEARQEIEWLIPDVLPAGAVVLLSGREGTMKSWLALSMAHAVASGAPWLGRATKQGAVLYLDGEMPPAVLQERLRGIGTAKDLYVWSWTDPEFPCHLSGNPSLDKAAHHHQLIVVDTLRRQMKGLKENSSDDMATITNALKELTRHGATVLVLHHAPKGIEKQGYRGSTELGAGVDVAISLVKKNTGSECRLVLETHKTRYSSSQDLEITVTKVDRAPLFSVGQSEKPKRRMTELYITLLDLKNGLGRAPIQTEILTEAIKRSLGGRDVILEMLEEGEGELWTSARHGRSLAYTLIEE
jgi:archaellum biogenesis ATPase FlaH